MSMPRRRWVGGRAGRTAEGPDQAQLSLDIGHAISAGQELRPVLAKLSYSPDTVVLDQLKIGEPGGVTIDGAGAFDRRNATGKLALNASTPSFARLVRFVTPFAPAAVTARLNQMTVKPGPAALKLSLDL